MNSPEHSCAKLANYDFDDVVSKTWLASFLNKVVTNLRVTELYRIVDRTI
ncbi:hypothetical protein HanPSC8_Chr12g0503291 [Helianthus annuus]|nr:hypothetical protein HanPSC8_Chr12g0503291 [Helianthus annuus]